MSEYKLQKVPNGKCERKCVLTLNTPALLFFSQLA